MIRTSSVTIAKYGGDRGSRAGCRRKVLCFLCVHVYHAFDEVCDNGNFRNATKQCHFQNNYGVIAYRKVCSCASLIYV